MTEISLSRGDVFTGRYVVERPLGRGGFASVFDCRSTQSNEAVALKVLHPDADGGYDPKTVARFRREAAALSRLRSRHAIRLIDHGEADGLLYLATERLGGQDLSEYLQSVPHLDEAAALHILRQLLDALEDAHNHGLLHRDIKPENIRIEHRDGDDLFVTLLDFGLARYADDGHPAITATGELVGTPRYMSPEQLRGVPLTAASDIYSLGVVLLEMLVGRDALHGSGWGAQLDRMRTGHVLAAPMIEHISPEVRALIQGMTTPHEQNRLRTVAAVRAKLDGELSRADVVAPPTRGIALPVVAVLLLVVGVAAVVAARGSEEVIPRPVPREGSVTPLLKSGAQDASVLEPAVPDMPSKRPDGCGKEAPVVGHGTIGVVDVYVPKSYDPAQKTPLVVLFHQWEETGAKMMEYTGFKPLAERDRVVLIAPSSGAHLGEWLDLEEVSASVDEVEEALCIDEDRIFLVGQASGGAAVYSLACEPWVAGFVTNSYRLKTTEQLCEPALAKPHLLLSGKHSPVSPFDGGPGDCVVGRGPKISVVAQEQLWVERNGCEPSSRKRYLKRDHNECFRWSCKAPFESCHLDGGQPWPGTKPEFSLHDAMGCTGEAPDFDSREVIWDFLLQTSKTNPGD